MELTDNYDESTDTKTHIRIQENKVDIHINNKDLLNTNIGKLFYLIMGKCTKSLKAKLQVLSKFQAIEYKNDTIVFLRAIKEAPLDSRYKRASTSPSGT